MYKIYLSIMNKFKLKLNCKDTVSWIKKKKKQYSKAWEYTISTNSRETDFLYTVPECTKWDNHYKNEFSSI